MGEGIGISTSLEACGTTKCNQWGLQLNISYLCPDPIKKAQRQIIYKSQLPCTDHVHI